MDWVNLRQKFTDFVRKYRYAAIVLVVGLGLMMFPLSTDTDDAPETPQQQLQEEKVDLSEQLQDILGQIRGAGQVRVLLTQSKGERVIYQTDEDRSSDGSLRVDTVIVTDKEKNQTGLVQQIEAPVYLGAVIVCQGADQPSVRLVSFGDDFVAVCRYIH